MATRTLLETLAGSDVVQTPTIGPVLRQPMDTAVVVDNAAFPLKEAPRVEVVKGNVRIIPYNAIHDPQADDFLRFMWRRMQKDDLVDYYFPGQRDTGYATFVRLMSGDAQVALVLTEATTGQWNDTVAGMITWTPSRMGASDVTIAGFIFFREFWDHHTTDNAGAAAFKYWFTETPATVVLGVCPSQHVTALRYNRRIGLKEVGRIPQAHLFKGAPCDAVLVAITKDEWQAKEDK